MPIIGDFANGLVGDLESFAICEHRVSELSCELGF